MDCDVVNISLKESREGRVLRQHDGARVGGVAVIPLGEVVTIVGLGG